jgi:hypothetical protein
LEDPVELLEKVRMLVVQSSGIGQVCPLHRLTENE